MNQSQQADRMRGAVGAYVDAIGVPRYEENAVRLRMSRVRDTGDSVAGRASRLVATAFAACAILVIFVIGSPSVRAQVERMLQAFAVIGGQTVPIEVNSVSLEQARRDVSFAVIPPAAIPANLSEEIDELNPSASRLDAQLVFRFSEGSGLPALTIVETRARQAAPDATRLWMTTGRHPLGAPPLPNAASGEHAFMQFGKNGQVKRLFKVTPMTWVVRGTRINLISLPGSLSPEQVAAIRRAML
jgi:hypothetical protein